MKQVRSLTPLCLCLTLLMPLAAWAHTENLEVGFLSGFLHPVFGLDHFLAMLSVGIVSAQMGGRQIWVIPSIFLSSMIFGAILGIQGIGLPMIEVGIAVSVIILGMAIVIAKRNHGSIPITIFVVFFGIFHGHAHGLEMPNTADPAFYGFGFLLSTSLIHLLGVGVGHLFTRGEVLSHTLRHMGSVMAGMGIMILLNALG